jgi:tRNA U34 2-thiouridine synthase MnmA/TrmU
LLANMSFVQGPPNGATRLSAQARYREEAALCVVEDSVVTFEKPHLAPPGQSLVVYDGDKLVGGGIITAAAPR